MKFTTLSRRTAAAGAASALVAGALVGATSTGAQAAPISNQYLCSSLLGEFPLFLDSDAPTLDPIPQVSAGQAVPAGLLDVSNTFTIPEEVRNALSENNIEDLTFPDFAGSFGGSEVPVEGVAATVSAMTDNGNGTWSVDAPGVNGAFETPRAGTYDVLSPEAFTIVANGAINVDCVLAEGTELGSYKSLPVEKNTSSVTAKGPAKAVKKGKVATLKAKVAALNETPGGKVVFKKGAKKLGTAKLNAKGVATLKTKALKVGNNKITAIYNGDGYTTKGKSEPIVVKVKR
jgi:hypothetical protein